MKRLPHLEVEIELEPSLFGMKLVRQAHTECVRAELHDRTFAPFEKAAQAVHELGVAEPQSNPHPFPFVPVARAGPLSRWNPGPSLSIFGGEGAGCQT
jgi:hypothetical protein